MATAHNHGPNFGKKVAGCPRCNELKAGAKPVRWSTSSRREREQQFDRSRRDHFAPGGPHAHGDCGPVCTFGDW